VTVFIGVLLVVAGTVGGWLITPSNVQLAAERWRLQQAQTHLLLQQQQLEVMRRQLGEEGQRLAEEWKQFEVIKLQEPAQVAGSENAPPKPEPSAPQRQETQVAVGVPPAVPVRQPPTGKTWRNSLGMDFVRIPAGKFMMGSDTGGPLEKPVHEVHISKPFYLGKYEVTQKEWQAVMGTNPSSFKEDANLPVESVSWKDVQTFIQKLNVKEGDTRYRLPTEAEWEYAARAGTTTVYSFGSDERQLDEYAWYYANASNKTHPVGGKKPNAWGLYDMHGNVWEWVQDWYGLYAANSVTDPQGPPSGSSRMCRGGSWDYDAKCCRSADRRSGSLGIGYGHVGFRLLRTAE
jgi:formylglycine-generating enzyme required for sulfatase activity